MASSTQRDPRSSPGARGRRAAAERRRGLLFAAVWGFVVVAIAVLLSGGDFVPMLLIAIALGAVAGLAQRFWLAYRRRQTAVDGRRP